eukprot:gene21928-28007_t
MHIANQVFSRVNIIDFSPGYYSLSEVIGLDGPLNEVNAISVYRQLMEILSFVHSVGVSLRNICTDSIMISHNTDDNVLGLCKKPVLDPTIHVKIIDLESAIHSSSRSPIPVSQFFSSHTQKHFVPPEVHSLLALQQTLSSNSNNNRAVPFDNSHPFGCRRYRLFQDTNLKSFLTAYCENLKRMDRECYSVSLL